ncbi:MAG: 2-dehydro-3-deoxy-6-phosphogalactonate aldolase [Pseudomonadota bacterium]
MDPAQIWRTADVKLIAILRGVQPQEMAGIADALLGAEFPAIEVPLNSPDPFASIEIAVKRGADAGPRLIGAGTVLDAADVDRVADVGGNLIVSPNMDLRVVEAALARGMACFPGVFTATEAHAAVRAGATGLKFFPASLLGPSGIQAIRATLPDISLCAVGGVAPQDFAAYRAAGVEGFGLGSSLYAPGARAEDVARAATESVAAYQ